MSAYPGSSPAFAAAGSVGLLAWRYGIARPSHPDGSGQWLARHFSALQSRGGDGFSPSSRHGPRDECGGPLRRYSVACRKAPGEQWRASRLVRNATRETLSRVFASAGAHADARAPRRPHLHFERRLKNLLEQLPPVHLAGRADPQATALVQ